MVHKIAFSLQYVHLDQILLQESRVSFLQCENFICHIIHEFTFQRSRRLCFEICELLVIQELILLSDVHWGGGENTPASNSSDLSARYCWGWHVTGLANLFPYSVYILHAENTKVDHF